MYRGAAAVVVARSGSVTHERHLIPGFGRIERIQRRLIDWTAAVACVARDLPDLAIFERHLEDVPSVRRRPFACEQELRSVKPHVRIGGAVEPLGQHLAAAVGSDPYDPCSVAVPRAAEKGDWLHNRFNLPAH